MYLGICIYQNDTYHYTKPFLYSSSDSEDKDYFTAQLIRDVDFSLIVELGEFLKIHLIKYKKKDSYLQFNENNVSPVYVADKIGIICSYDLYVTDLEKYDYSPEYIKLRLFRKLDDIVDLSIEFTVIERISEKDYILCTPKIRGKKYLLTM
jgi:hypothetical protein